MCPCAPGFSLSKPVHPLIGILKIAPFFGVCWQLLGTKCGQMEPFSASLVRAGVSKTICLPCPAPARLGSVTPELPDKNCWQSHIIFFLPVSHVCPLPGSSLQAQGAGEDAGRPAGWRGPGSVAITSIDPLQGGAGAPLPVPGPESCTPAGILRGSSFVPELCSESGDWLQIWGKRQ